jgi:hypothetical protein
VVGEEGCDQYVANGEDDGRVETKELNVEWLNVECSNHSGEVGGQTGFR